MKVHVNWYRMTEDSTNGYGVQVVNTFHSFDKAEIDNYVKWLEEKFGDGFVMEDNTYERQE